MRFLKFIELDHDPFLDSVSHACRPHLGVAFARAYWVGEFGTKGPRADSQQVASGTVGTALGNISTTFRIHQRPDPFRGSDGERHRILQLQIASYRKRDPKKKQQKAIPARVVRHTVETATDELEEHKADLIGGSFFFACRSCEYSKVSGERRTKLLTLGDIEFWKKGRVMEHYEEDLDSADKVSITFTLQKNNVQYERITMWRSNNDGVLCPVRRWARLVRRIRSYGGAVSSSTPVNLCWDPHKRRYVSITSADITTSLRKSVSAIGENVLGFKPEEVGTHSIRSGAAMAMYLTGTPIYTIMLIGRWTSDSWLHYIRTQVEDFTKDISTRMSSSEHFFTLPSERRVADPRDEMMMAASKDPSKSNEGGSHFGLPAVAASLFSLAH
jgi:hypothetical protein